MGPYCRFCDTRCFVHVPENTPPHLLEVYKQRFHGDLPIIATCGGGQAHERKTIGFSYDDIMEAIAKENTVSWLTSIATELEAGTQVTLEPARAGLLRDAVTRITGGE